MTSPDEKIPLLDLKAQHKTIAADVMAAVARVFESQHFIGGPDVAALEGEVAKAIGAKHGVGMSSGTDALVVALLALGVGPGDEVVTTPYTFVATASSIARTGARAVFVDIDPATYNLRADEVDAACSSRTKAIIPVHLFGLASDMTAIMKVARARNIPVIEDAAQAIGAKVGDAHAAAIGDMGCLSFFPSKNLGGAGDGGMIVTNDAARAEELRLLRNQGSSPKYFAKIVGGNFRLDTLQAAVLRVKLPHLSAWSAARRKNAAFYTDALVKSGVASTTDAAAPLRLPHEPAGFHHVYNQYTVRVRGAGKRDALRAHLEAKGIATEIYYPVPMHLQEAFAYWGYQKGAFPESESAALETFAVPVYPELPESHRARVIDALVSFFK